MRSARGQGTIEYLAVVLLVAVVFGGFATVSASGAAGDIAAAVPREIIRAFCIVRGGDCYRDRAPCDVASTRKSSGWHATVVIVRFGRDKVILREERSDHSVLVTLTNASSLGLGAIQGAELHAGSFAVGGALAESIMGSYGHGRTWALASDREADALIAALADGREPRPADRDVKQGGLDLSASRSRASRDDLSADASVELHGAAGTVIDRRDGSETYFVEGGADAVLGASATLRSLTVSGQAGLGATARLALTRRGGRWVDAALLATGEVSGSVSISGTAGEVADTLNTPVAGARRWVVEARLDLTEPDSREAANALLDRLGSARTHPDAVKEAAVALAHRIDENAVVHISTYALDRTSSGFGAQAGARFGAGFSKDKTTETTRLVAAATRAHGGHWDRRDDCTQEARR